MLNLTEMSYDELQYYMVVCYYSCDHNEADRIISEMKRRFPDQYYKDLYSDD